MEKKDQHQNKLQPEENKFHKGNGDDGKHYWLTPPDLMKEMEAEFNFDFDACPFPKPDDFDGLTNEWGQSTYVNPPFGSIIHEGKKKGPTAWMRKGIEEFKKGKDVVIVYPVDKWILMMLAAGAEVRNLGDVKWVATEDGSTGKGTGRHIAQFILRHQENQSLTTANEQLKAECERYKEALEKILPLSQDLSGYHLKEINQLATAALTKDN
jgi:hypothetical protein